MAERREEVLGLAVRIATLREELARLEAEFDRQLGSSPAPATAPRETQPAGPRSPMPDTLRARVESVFRQSARPVSLPQLGKALGIQPNRARSTITRLLEVKRIKKVKRGVYAWVPPETANGAGMGSSGGLGRDATA